MSGLTEEQIRRIPGWSCNIHLERTFDLDTIQCGGGL